MTKKELVQRAKPILFNTEMVQAILEGRKTVTRRCVKFPVNRFVKDVPNPNELSVMEIKSDKVLFYQEPFFCISVKPPFEVGDYLYVRETWSEWTDGYLYKAWTGPFQQPGKSSIMRWYPSIHMPKEAARIFLKVTDVRVERLQDMSKEDIKKEGIYDDNTYPTDRSIKAHPMAQGGWTEWAYKERFKMIWNSTIKKQDLDTYGWEANPWAWVLEFERIEVANNE